MPSNNSEFAQQDREISLLDILRFLKSAYKTITITGVVGLATAIAYLAIAPKQYEAVVQIAMAQIGTSSNINNIGNNSVNPLGINIEEPSLLISRLSSPTSFTPEVLGVCKTDTDLNSSAALAKVIKLASPRGVANIVELRTFAASPQDAKSCAKAIFELIKSTQAQIMAPYVEEARIKLLDDEERLHKARDLVAKADKSGSAMGAAYLSTRDEIRFLMDEITALKNVVTSNQSRATRLIAPIYTSDIPIAPNKRMALAGGLVGGLFLGLLIALARKVIYKLISDMGGGR